MFIKSSDEEKLDRPATKLPSRQAECCKSAWRRAKSTRLPHASAAWLK